MGRSVPASIALAFAVAFAGCGKTNSHANPDSADASETTVAISKSGIHVDDELVIALSSDRATLARQGVDEKFKREGEQELYIVPLAERLREVREAKRKRQPGAPLTEAIIVADSMTPYRLLVEVLVTLGQSNFSRFYVLRAEDGVARNAHQKSGAATSGLRSPSSGSGSGEPVVAISSDGYSVRLEGHALSPGCEQRAPHKDAVTVPLADGRPDTAGLRRCAEQIKRGSPRQTSVVISADYATAYQEVIDAIDAMRGADGELFHEVVFAVQPLAKR